MHRLCDLCGSLPDGGLHSRLTAGTGRTGPREPMEGDREHTFPAPRFFFGGFAGDRDPRYKSFRTSRSKLSRSMNPTWTWRITPSFPMKKVVGIVVTPP